MLSETEKREIVTRLIAELPEHARTATFRKECLSVRAETPEDFERGVAALCERRQLLVESASSSQATRQRRIDEVLHGRRVSDETARRVDHTLNL